MGMDFFVPSRSLTFVTFGMLLFHSLPVPEFWECFFSFPLSFLNFGIGIIHSRSHSRTPKSHSRSPLIACHAFCKLTNNSLLKIITRTTYFYVTTLKISFLYILDILACELKIRHDQVIKTQPGLEDILHSGTCEHHPYSPAPESTQHLDERHR